MCGYARLLYGKVPPKIWNLENFRPHRTMSRTLCLSARRRKAETCEALMLSFREKCLSSAELFELNNKFWDSRIKAKLDVNKHIIAWEVYSTRQGLGARTGAAQAYLNVLRWQIPGHSREKLHFEEERSAFHRKKWSTSGGPGPKFWRQRRVKDEWYQGFTVNWLFGNFSHHGCFLYVPRNFRNIFHRASFRQNFTNNRPQRVYACSESHPFNPIQMEEFRSRPEQRLQIPLRPWLMMFLVSGRAPCSNCFICNWIHGLLSHFLSCQGAAHAQTQPQRP